MTKKCFFILFIHLVFLIQGYSQIRTYSNEFLSLGVGADALAMGNARIASATDVNAGFWNPAGIVQLDNAQISAMHAEWFAGVAKYDYVGFATPIADGLQAIGASIIRFGVDDIPNTLELIEPDGSLNYNNITTFSAADYAVLLTYARYMGNIRLGGNAKIIHRRVGSFATAWGFGLDAGLQWHISDNFIFAASVKDLTTTPNLWSYSFTEEEKAKLDATGNVIPVNSTELTGQRIILGIGKWWWIGEKLSVLTELNIDVTVDGERNVLLKSDPVSADPHAGLEINYNDLVFLRAGVNNIQQFLDDNAPSNKIWSVQPSLGVGLQLGNVQIDYAFTGLNNVDLGIFSNVFSLKLNFGGKETTTSEY